MADVEWRTVTVRGSGEELWTATIAVDIDKMARSIYKDYEGCPDSYVDQVWDWESIPEVERHDLEARDAFEQTVEEFTEAARNAVAAGLGIPVDEPNHEHDWVDMSNDIVKNGHYCRICGLLK